MGRYISEESKFKNGRGLGTGASYKPWTKCSDFNDIAPASSYPDWKTGRPIQCHSAGERYYYIMLRWNDAITDIREHFPLPITETMEIAKSLGFQGIQLKKRVLLTDFLLTFTDGSLMAISIAYSREKLKKNPNRIKRLIIEKKYWKEHGVHWDLLYTEDINIVYARNLEDIVSYINMNKIPDKIGLAKYLIAKKKIIVNLKEKINYIELVKSLKKEEIWKEHLYMLENV